MGNSIKENPEKYIHEMTDLINRADMLYTRILTPNDTGETGGHQSGIYLPRSLGEMFFSEPLDKGKDKEREVQIKWPDSIFTDSRVKHYGSKNELRITRFGKSFPYLKPEFTESLLILIRVKNEFFGFVFQDPIKIIEILNDCIGFLPARIGSLICLSPEDSANEMQTQAIDEFVKSLNGKTPGSYLISEKAREISRTSDLNNDDEKLKAWTDTETKIWQEIEKRDFDLTRLCDFSGLNNLLNFSDQVKNSRKTRLKENYFHHLSYLFHQKGLYFTEKRAVRTQENPEFSFRLNSAGEDESDLVVLIVMPEMGQDWIYLLEKNDDKQIYLLIKPQKMTSKLAELLISVNIRFVIPDESAQKNTKIKHNSKALNLEEFISLIHYKQS